MEISSPLLRRRCSREKVKHHQDNTNHVLDFFSPIFSSTRWTEWKLSVSLDRSLPGVNQQHFSNALNEICYSSDKWNLLIALTTCFSSSSSFFFLLVETGSWTSRGLDSTWASFSSDFFLFNAGHYHVWTVLLKCVVVHDFMLMSVVVTLRWHKEGGDSKLDSRLVIF